MKLVTPSTDIQNVINKAEEGSTIYFAPGTYTGNVTFGGKSLTLKGANAGVNPNTETRGEESVITGTFSTSREKLSTEAVADRQLSLTASSSPAMALRLVIVTTTPLNI